MRKMFVKLEISRRRVEKGVQKSNFNDRRLESKIRRANENQIFEKLIKTPTYTSKT